MRLVSLHRPNSLLKNQEPNTLTLYDRWAVYVLFDSIRPTHYLKFVNTSLYVSTFYPQMFCLNILKALALRKKWPKQE